MVYEDLIPGKTVCLRSIEERDAEATFLMRSDPEKSRFIHAAKGTVDDQVEFIRRQRKTPGDYLFVAEDVGDGRLVGMRGVYHWSPEEKVAESGRLISIGNQIQGTEIMMLGFDFAFDVLGVDRVFMTTLEPNASVLSIQQRAGAKVIRKVPDEEFGCLRYESYLERSDYFEKREHIFSLIERFAGR